MVTTRGMLAADATASAGSNQDPTTGQTPAAPAPAAPAPVPVVPIPAQLMGTVKGIQLIFPAPRHNRATGAYQPTHQPGQAGNRALHYPNERGTPPTGISADDWERAFNNANSFIYTRLENAGCTKEQMNTFCQQARADGRTRDLGVETLIRQGRLDASFRDNNI